MKYLLVQYQAKERPSAIIPFDEMPEIGAFLEKPENAFAQWDIYEIARQVPYKSRVSVEIVETPLKCPACTSTEQRVLNTRNESAKVTRLRCCGACGHRWTTVELDAQNLSRMESAIQAMRSFATLSKELDDGSAAHG